MNYPAPSRPTRLVVDDTPENLALLDGLLRGSFNVTAMNDDRGELAGLEMGATDHSLRCSPEHANKDDGYCRVVARTAQEPGERLADDDSALPVAERGTT